MPASPIDLRVQLRDDIVRCVLAPGQRLKFDELRARYDAGIGSLREALLQLVAEGLVVAESNRGFCVAPVSIADLEDLTDLRIELEAKALTLSIQHGDDAWESAIVAALHMLIKLDADISQTPPRNRAAWEERHRIFHDSLVAACPSAWVARFRKILFDQSQRYRAVSLMQSQTPGRIDKHRELADLVLARDVAGSTAAMAEHIRHTAENVRQWLSLHGQEMATTDFLQDPDRKT
jgi:DNA-binding GntR family transcriptional regulator